jgi:hypothetical protein
MGIRIDRPPPRRHLSRTQDDPDGSGSLTVALSSAALCAHVTICMEKGHTSVKVKNPDGYVVELAWDIQ